MSWKPGIRTLKTQYALFGIRFIPQKYAAKIEGFGD
jgi:hypothetical protein